MRVRFSALVVVAEEVRASGAGNAVRLIAWAGFVKPGAGGENGKLFTTGWSSSNPTRTTFGGGTSMGSRRVRG